MFWPLAFLGALGLAAVGWLRSPRPAETPVAVVAAPAPQHTAAPTEAGPPPDAAPPPVVQGPPVVQAPPTGLQPSDYRTFEALAAKISAGRVEPADIETAAALQVRFPGEKALEQLVTELLLSHAHRELAARRFPAAIAALRRAADLPWADARPRQALLRALMASEDWPAIEAHASLLLASDRRDAEAWYALGLALFRLDRNQEAAEALRNCLALGDEARAQALLARIQKAAADERGMTAQNVSHFHVRYDGDEHVEVGREIVSSLERHYATLSSRLDHRPSNAIPVILYSRERYHQASGAPIWAGGSYDSLDGRIRVPIGGLTRSLTPDMDETLIHELTHAFIADRTRGTAPRDVHEGLAQYMEGQRLSGQQLSSLARGEVGGVYGFYMLALAFVEHLVGTRGMGGINDLLRAMGETGDVDQAFRQVYNQNYVTTKNAWLQRLQQKHGS